MLSPLLVIGVGGAGGKTIRAMKQELNRILEASGYTDGIPAVWQFLHIDTTNDDASFPAPMLPPDEFHCVVPASAGYVDIVASITARCTQQDQQKLLAGWGVPRSAIMINRGSGQTRAIGRLVGIADSMRIVRAIQNSISRMQSPSAQFELFTAAKCLGVVNNFAQPQALIFSSLGGGTGSGMFIDIAELLKISTPQAWAHNSTSFLYTPEVFAGIGSMGARIPKNTLGAFNELIASKSVELTSHTELLLAKMGLPASNTFGKPEFGCRTNILIGAQNSSGTDLRIGTDGFGMDEVFRSIGQALASAVTSDETSEFMLNAFSYSSWNHGALDASGLAPESTKLFNSSLIATGIGFGKLSLGVDHMVEYVADAMTKHQIKILLWPELSTVMPKDDDSILEVIQEKADDIWPNFLLNAGLGERGSQSQIVDALLPDQLQDRVKLFVNGIISKNVSTKDKPLATFSKAVWSEWVTEADSVLRTIKNEIGSEAQKWVPTIQEKLRDQISHELALNGYAVLTHLTERLEVELRDHLMAELLQDHHEFSNAISGFDQHVFNVRVNEFADGLTAVSTQDGPFLQKLSASLTRVLEFQIHSHVTALAASLIQDMLTLFVTPLKEQLKDSKTTLQIIQNADLLPNGSKNPYLSYPDWASGIVPNRYKPGVIERNLIDSSEYESIYEFCASNDSMNAAPFQQSVNAALLGKKMNPMPGDVNPQNLITFSSPWITSVRDAQDVAGAVASKSKWNFHTDLTELSERNRRWLKNKDSAFGKFLNISIREFVGAAGEGPQIRAQREFNFVKEFEEMLRTAKPLVTLNPKAMSHVLSVSDGESSAKVLMKASKIPFAASSYIGQACTMVLQQNGFNPADPSFEQFWFDTGSNNSSIITVSTIQNPLPVWAFASLTEPILKEVDNSKNHSQTWNQFWEGRRSRPLVEAVPFETEIRRSIITGWFVASLLGLRKVESVPVGRTAKIWNPTLEIPDWSSFPSPLLNSHFEDMRRNSWLLPQVLMSAGIALANFGKTGDPEFINGYRLLKYLGREVTTSFKGRDHWDGNGHGDKIPSGERSQSSYLRNWVQFGDLPSGSHPLHRLLLNALDDNPDRKHAFNTAIEELRSQYNEIWEKFSDTPWHSLPETWELKEDIDLALSDIAEYVRNL